MNILISSCLLGENVRYDGNNNKIDSIESILNSHTLFSFCPEVEGGLSTPRPPAEIQNQEVITIDNNNVTKAFIAGANKTLALCKENKIKIALLKAKSPSCGNIQIYDGSFTSKLINGQGITAKLLIENGIKVFNEQELKEFVEYIKNVTT